MVRYIFTFFKISSNFKLAYTLLKIGKKKTSVYVLHEKIFSVFIPETFYFFGDNDVVEWKDLLDEYILPPLQIPLHSTALSFGLAGPGTGVPFHFHGPGFAETIYGRKRWFLTAPDVRPEFHPNKTTLQWYFQDYAKVKSEIDLYECTLRPGEIIYFPDKWWHATLNLDTSVF